MSGKFDLKYLCDLSSRISRNLDAERLYNISGLNMTIVTLCRCRVLTRKTKESSGDVKLNLIGMANAIISTFLRIARVYWKPSAERTAKISDLKRIGSFSEGWKRNRVSYTIKWCGRCQFPVIRLSKKTLRLRLP
ncbi:hypothetical protein Zmor_020728 [Zophobas morio]|mgnify:FL=1|uniref:Uncharacterized protein n=1 Tax=Zophobas morio TaxID=2755281 RepID=A0AA38I464_9CUCU|nr:hypothetical protein Zmor_020728 [Zophobas morio]